MVLQTGTGQMATIERSSSISVGKKPSEVDSEVKTEAPQKVFEKNKTIFRSNQVIWYVLGIIETLLLFRFLFKVLGANPFSGFTDFIYNLTNPLEAPFSGIFRVEVSKFSVFEWSTLIAMGVYALLAYGIIKLFEFIKPVSPEEVEK